MRDNHGRVRRTLIQILGALALAGGMSVAAFAEELLLPDRPDIYVVKEGDTLWDIASVFLKDAWRWPEIWEVNSAIKDPHLIYPGDQVSFVAGRLAVRRKGTGATVKLSPPAGSGIVKRKPTIRSTPISSSIPSIPLDAIASMLTTGRIVEQHTLDGAPYILSGTADRLIFGPGDEFYARGEWSETSSVYGLFRKGNVYLDPETKEVLGFEAREVGLARVKERAGDVFTLELTSVKEDVRIGDRLLPTEERRVESTFHPAVPGRPVKGVIMTVMGGVTQVGRNDVVALNRGAIHGLEIGTILAVHKRGSVVRDRISRERVQLPQERAGVLMIFRTFEKMSYGLVLETEEPLRVGDEVTNP